MGKFKPPHSLPQLHTLRTRTALCRGRTMGILETITVPLGEQVSQRGLGVVIAAGFAAFLIVSVVLNGLSQILFKNPNEPPVVFHLFPIIGSTVTYGIDPYKFFFDNKAKVICLVADYVGKLVLTGW